MTPIIGLAYWESFRMSGDLKALEEIYAPLSRFDDWLWRRRNTGDGLVVWHRGEESGWDNAARHHPLPVKSLDGSCHAYLLRSVLGKAAELLGKVEDANKFDDRAERTARSINELMWDEGTGFYYDLGMDDARRSQKSLAGFLLLAKIASKERFGRLHGHLRDPEEFWTEYPVPTLSADDPDFEPSTWGWNGPVWLQTNWFVMEGLARYGQLDTAHDIFTKTVDLIFKRGRPWTVEHYNSRTGDVIGTSDYSWSVVLNHYIATRVCGVQAAADRDHVTLQPRLPAGWGWVEIKGLHVGAHELSVRYEKEGRTERFTLVHDGTEALTVDIVPLDADSARRVSLRAESVVVEIGRSE